MLLWQPFLTEKIPEIVENFSKLLTCQVTLPAHSQRSRKRFLGLAAAQCQNAFFLRLLALEY
jgi:hypothetical protein